MNLFAHALPQCLKNKSDRKISVIWKHLSWTILCLEFGVGAINSIKMNWNTKFIAYLKNCLKPLSTSE